MIKEKAYIGEAPIATVVGIIVGPYVTGLFNPAGWGGTSSHVKDEITLEVTRVIIAVSVFAVGVELPKVCVSAASSPHVAESCDRLTCGDIGDHWRSYLDHV